MLDININSPRFLFKVSVIRNLEFNCKPISCQSIQLQSCIKKDHNFTLNCQSIQSSVFDDGKQFAMEDKLL